MLKKLLHLIRVLMSIDESNKRAFHMLVWLKTEVVKYFSTRFDGNLTSGCQEADLLLEQLLRRSRPDTPSSISNGLDKWQRDPEDYDCSSAHRELRRAYSSVDCHLIPAMKVHLEDGHQLCFHMHSERMLCLLAKGAYGEIKHKVWLAVGLYLPEELAEQVFLSALAVEEVPRLACLREEDRLHDDCSFVAR
ncbi:hypothetical protein LTR56_023377 [Elasticomyces elasticus]|nr:hypothetical protein LTR22_027791 [Elasticomyces elasticus]KAK3620497.1 hypothetical protein LTR56_023377 [Elasticomyces elasticus]KAK4894508.1 hypothetical protein LTR49_028386 [Elasticomyces elasticus]